MCLAREGSCVSEANAKALSLLKAQLERWHNALPIKSLGRRKTDRELLEAYLACRAVAKAQPAVGSRLLSTAGR